MICDEKNELCKNLWEQCKDELTRLCRYRLSSHLDEVDDVIADAFYYLCVAVFEDRRIDNHKAWLTAVTNNLIKKKYTELNRTKLRNVSFYEEDIDIYEYSDDIFLDNLISDSVIERLSDTIICELSEKEQQLYYYIYKDKLKMKEIATLLDITEVNVRQRNHRLTKKLKNMIKEHLDEI
jgi:RNA polymerase sigma factor (sigma-70 family)